MYPALRAWSAVAADHDDRSAHAVPNKEFRHEAASSQNLRHVDRLFRPSLCQSVVIERRASGESRISQGRLCGMHKKSEHSDSLLDDAEALRRRGGRSLGGGDSARLSPCATQFQMARVTEILDIQLTTSSSLLSASRHAFCLAQSNIFRPRR